MKKRISTEDTSEFSKNSSLLAVCVSPPSGWFEPAPPTVPEAGIGLRELGVAPCDHDRGADKWEAYSRLGEKTQLRVVQDIFARANLDAILGTA